MGSLPVSKIGNDKFLKDILFDQIWILMASGNLNAELIEDMADVFSKMIVENLWTPLFCLSSPLSFFQLDESYKHRRPQDFLSGGGQAQKGPGQAPGGQG